MFTIRVQFRILDEHGTQVALLQTHDEVEATPRIGEAYLIDDSYDVRVVDIEHNLASPGQQHIRVVVQGIVFDPAQLVATLTSKAGGWLLVEGGHFGNGASG